MVKLYLNNTEGKKGPTYIDVKMWSLVKAFVLSYLICGGILFGIGFLLGFFGALLV
jgi:hypothetical protein